MKPLTIYPVILIISYQNAILGQVLGDEKLLLSQRKDIIESSMKDFLNKQPVSQETFSSTRLNERRPPPPIMIHEHDHNEKSRHYHKNKHQHSHTQKGRHIHRHEHHHNHKHNHAHDHDDEHDQSHSHKFSADHKHLHQKKLVVNKGWKRHNNEIAQSDFGGPKDSMKHPSHVETYKNKNKNSLTKDYHIKSVENYIGDSGKEFEGAAEQIVESYMGEYMQEYMQGWYSEYCEKTGQFCDQVKLKHSTRDKKTGTEIVYNVASSDGYVPDQVQHRIQSSTTTLKPSTSTPATITTVPSFKKLFGKKLKEKAKSKKRKAALVEKMKTMFQNLHKKFEEKKVNISKNPEGSNNAEETTTEKSTPSSTSIKPRDFDLDIKLDGDFYDFVPMEYEVVEDVIIENY